MLTQWMNLLNMCNGESKSISTDTNFAIKWSPLPPNQRMKNGKDLKQIWSQHHEEAFLFWVLSSEFWVSLSWLIYMGIWVLGRERLGWVNLGEPWEARGWGVLSTDGSFPGKDEWCWSHFISQVQLNSKAVGDLQTLHQAKYILGIHINY